MNTRELLQKALNDPVLEIEVLTPDNYQQIKSVVSELSECVCISEWMHKSGMARYEYHVHRSQINKEFMEYMLRNIRPLRAL